MENKMQDSKSLREKIENTINVIQFEKGRDLTVAESITTGGMDRIMQIVASEISKAKEERTEELRRAFHETFFKSGELWFDYTFEDGDVEQEKEAKEIVEEYWKDVLDNLSNKGE